jgi:glutathione gamma-glutamylcysteinyltransferase
MLPVNTSPCLPSTLPASPDGTVYMRPLPAELESLDSRAGRTLFAEALQAGTMEGYFKLAQQFHTQADPAFCGLGSLVCGLNALGIDPQRRWKGPWRWFSEELLDCCKALEDVQREGVTLDEVACLARCSQASVAVLRPPESSIELFRRHVHDAATRGEGPVVIANYSRRVVGQTGSGHFSPIAGYHAAADRVLVLDTARFKYPPHWMPVPLLYAAMQERDSDTGGARGWLVLDRTIGH